MHQRYRFFLYLAVILLLFSPASICQANHGRNYLLWWDDMGDGPGDWTHEDLTASAESKFHIDTYLAFDDPLHETDYSWWCGTFDYDADGGYGNAWDQRLELPPIQISQTVVENISWGAIKARYRASDEADGPSEERGGRPDAYPILTFAYRYDSEPGYDYTYVQAESLGVFVDLNSGYNGTSSGWQDYGAYGFELAEYDDPLMLRFRFISDGAWSDEDGLYYSVGGAFHVDNIKVYDFYGGTVYFFDDVQDGSLCSPGVPGAAGDYWHLVDDVCSSHVIPSWWCGDDADTSLIPPNLHNALYTPVINCEVVWGPCTLRFAIHAEVPTVDNDYWSHSVRFDGGNWYQLRTFWGDFAQCDGFGSAGLNGFDLYNYLPANTVQARVVFHTTDNGCGPGAAGGAGINIDDTWIEYTQYPRGELGQAELDAQAELNRRVAAAKRSLNRQRVSGLVPYKGY